MLLSVFLSVFPAQVRLLAVTAGLLWLGIAQTASGADERPSYAPVDLFLKKHCLACHGDQDPKAGLTLTKFRSAADIVTHRKAWDSVVDMVEIGEMPPADRPQPTADERTAFLKAIGDIIADDERRAPLNPGRVTMRRLNRAEYDNTIRDLFYGLDINASEDFPSDDIGHGFDNIGDVLSMSPVLMERYLSAADNIAKKAILTTIPKVNQRSISMQYTQPSGKDVPLSGQYRVVTVKPEATPHESGPLFAQFAMNQHDEYILKFGCYAERDRTIDGPQADNGKKLDLDAALDGKPSKNKSSGVSSVKEEPIRVAAFVYGKNLPDGASDEEVAKLYGAAWPRCRPCRILQVVEVKSRNRNQTDAFQIKIPPMPGIEYIGVSVVKPSDGLPPTRVFFKYLGVDGPVDMRPYSMRQVVKSKPDQTPASKTREVLSRFATRAFRRPATSDEVERLAKIVDSVQASGGKWETGLQLAIQAVLASPKFLFRAELDDRPTAPDTRAIDEYQLASRLSYFFWSSMPDDELFELAAKKQLTANLDSQVRRMLLDPRSNSLVDEFAMQWLQLDRLRTHAADPTMFPSFGEPLRAAMIKETQLFLQAIIREDRPITDIITADFTFLNKTLADHYGIADTVGNSKSKKKDKIPGGLPINNLTNWLRVQLPPGSARGGLLTQASVLTVSSNPTRTSPVKRGKWVLEQLLGTPPPPPPANVPELEAQKDKLTGTLRQQMEQHRKNPACANCHAKMDPLGFAFENFNAVGGYRDEDEGKPVDASGTLPDGRTFQGPAELKKILSEKKREFAHCLTEKLLTFALGRGLEYYDRRAVNKIVTALEQNEFKFSTLCVEIARSDPFRLRRGVEATTAAAR